MAIPKSRSKIESSYIGHETQVRGIEEHRLIGGKGDGMRLYEVVNGKGMELSVLPDRSGDISRLKYKGMNMSYMSPCGYVGPAYFGNEGTNWLASFTAGYLTTCGLESVGSPCVDQGEELSLHGSISNQPAQHSYWIEEEDNYRIFFYINDEVIFGRKLRLIRELEVSKLENRFTIKDLIQNRGDKEEPIEILYHMNIGYPLLDEDSILEIPSDRVIARDAHAQEDIENWKTIEKPTNGYIERCYYHQFDSENGSATIVQPKLKMGLQILFSSKELDGFVEWKMMGKRDYVLGLECGNCYPDGRDVMRKKGMLKFLAPGEEKQYTVTVNLFDV